MRKEEPSVKGFHLESITVLFQGSENLLCYTPPNILMGYDSSTHISFNLKSGVTWKGQCFDLGNICPFRGRVVQSFIEQR